MRVGRIMYHCFTEKMFTVISHWEFTARPIIYCNTELKLTRTSTTNTFIHATGKGRCQTFWCFTEFGDKITISEQRGNKHKSHSVHCVPALVLD